MVLSDKQSKSTGQRVEFECNSCGGRLSVEEERLGSRGSCPFCGTAVVARHGEVRLNARLGAGAPSSGFRASRVIVPAGDFAADDSWKLKYARQKKSWMRRRSLEKKIERAAEWLVVRRGRLIGFLVFTTIVGGLVAFAFASGR